MSLFGVPGLMNVLAIAELTAVVFFVVFVLRALIGVRQEYRVREGRLYMHSATDQSRDVEAVPSPFDQRMAIPRRKLDWRVYGSAPMNHARRRSSAPGPKTTPRHVREKRGRI